MTDIQMPKLQIGDLTVNLPIVQGGMGVGVSMSGLASAVAKEGGVGVISSVAMSLLEGGDVAKGDFRKKNTDILVREIRKVRAVTDGALGVNIMMALTDHEDHVEAAVKEGVDMIFMGAGLPLKNPLKNGSVEDLKKVKTKFIPKVSSAKATRLIFQHWAKHFNHIPDAVAVEGPMAGGHLGFKGEQLDDPAFALEKIVPEVVDIVRDFEMQFNKKIPVIAAGGVYTGDDIYKFLNLGASAVKMGTRFAATIESDASDEFKKAYLDCKKEDIVIIQSPVGLPGRAIMNKFIEDVKEGIKKPFKCSWKCLKTCDFRKVPYCIAQALANARLGKLKEGFAFAGSNAYRIDKIISVKELINGLVDEYKKAVKKAMSSLKKT